MKANVERFQALRGVLEQQILGQREVIPSVVDTLLDGELGLTGAGRPKGSFLFLGPTGVGKTELTVAFTRHLFGDEHLVRFDMSEYQNQESVGILLGHSEHETGLVARRLREVGGKGTVLLDEIEKAHPRVLDLLLQMLDAARLTMANGETVDFSECYLVCTSNIAGAAILDVRHSVRATLVRFVEAQAQAALRPEIFARFQVVSVFDRLGYDDQLAIARHLLEREIREQSERTGIEIDYDAGLIAHLTGEGYHPRLGARPMRRCIERFVRQALRERLLKGQTEGICLQPPSLTSAA